MNQVQTVVQSSAARGEELSAMALELQGRSDELLGMVSRFKISAA